MTDDNDQSFGVSRRSLVKWGGAAALAASIPITVAATNAGAEPAGESGEAVRLRWLGTNAWEFKTAATTVLIDPWVSRFPTGAYTEAGADPETEIRVHEDVIDEHVSAADCVLVTHGHWDHIADVPYIAKKTGATVLGTETHLNLLRAMKAPEEQLGQVVGGEYYQFKGFTVEVFASSHSASGDHKQILFGGTRPGTVPKRPTKIKHLVEGGSLSYLLDFGGVSFLNAGSANFHGRDVSGLEPTVLFIQPGGGHTPDYVERLLKATGYPRYVVPTHWDDFDLPLTEPAEPGGDIDTLHERVAKASPDSEFIRIDHLESHDFHA